MTYKEIYDPEKFDLRDSYWKFLSVKDGELTARVEEVNILSGENQGQVIETAVVTFRGFRLEWFRVAEEGEKTTSPVPNEKAPEILADGLYFVFSYWADNHECELAGLDGRLAAMLFAFDSAEITWEAS